jgi:MFS family permease
MRLGIKKAWAMNISSQQPAYRWVIVSASALILAVSMGAIINGISAFIVPMQEAYGWQRGEVTLINFSGILGLAFGGLVMGAQADRRGARPVVLFGVIVLGLSFLAASFATSLWQLYLLFFLAGFFGAGAIFSPVLAVVGNWFYVGAGMAIGIVSAGQALGQGGILFVSSFMIEALEIDGAFRATGIIMLITLVPLALLLRPPPALNAEQSLGNSEQEKNALPANYAITRMCAAIILCCICMSVPLMHLLPLIQDRGFASDEASGVIFIMLLVAIIGRLFFGNLADIIGALPAYMSATAWMTLMIFGFTFLENLQSFYIYAIVYGFGYAGVMTGLLISIRELTPPARRASALGIAFMFAWFGHAIGGYQGGVLYDFTGDYTAAYAVALVAGLLNLVIVSRLWRKTKGPQLLAFQQ